MSSWCGRIIPHNYAPPLSPCRHTAFAAAFARILCGCGHLLVVAPMIAVQIARTGLYYEAIAKSDGAMIRRGSNSIEERAFAAQAEVEESSGSADTDPPRRAGQRT